MAAEHSPLIEVPPKTDVNPDVGLAVLVDQRHLHLVCQPLRKQGAELQPTEPRPEDYDLALHPLSMLRLLSTCSTSELRYEDGRGS